jgi:hypothetical protein
MGKLVTMPATAQTLMCAKCRAAPALGVYQWETRVFANWQPRTALLCGECGLHLADIRKMFVPPDATEPVFYKINRGVALAVTFTYEQPHTREIEPQSIPHKRKLPNQIAPLTMIALARASHHDEQLANGTNSAHRGAPRRMWLKRVACSECRITYTAVRAKKCPSCGTVNTPN